MQLNIANKFIFTFLQQKYIQLYLLYIYVCIYTCKCILLQFLLCIYTTTVLFSLIYCKCSKKLGRVFFSLVFVCFSIQFFCCYCIYLWQYEITKKSRLNIKVKFYIYLIYMCVCLLCLFRFNVIKYSFELKTYKHSLCSFFLLYVLL